MSASISVSEPAGSMIDSRFGAGEWISIEKMDLGRARGVGSFEPEGVASYPIPVSPVEAPGDVVAL
jgi:hypothetical protein